MVQKVVHPVLFVTSNEEEVMDIVLVPDALDSDHAPEGCSIDEALHRYAVPSFIDALAIQFAEVYSKCEVNMVQGDEATIVSAHLTESYFASIQSMLNEMIADLASVLGM